MTLGKLLDLFAPLLPYLRGESERRENISYFIRDPKLVSTNGFYLIHEGLKILSGYQH